jgi:5-formyltetrahydrofolate cyclo-ligase
VEEPNGSTERPNGSTERADRTDDTRTGRARLRDARRRARRAAEPDRAGWSADAARCAHLRGLAAVLGVRCVAAYVARAGEPDPGAAVRTWREAGVTVLLPVLLPDDDLAFAAADTAPLRPGRRGLLEPVATARRRPLAEADLVIVPALLVDREGNRLGQGGGSYDRALDRRRTGVPAVALLREDELWVAAGDATLDTEGWDRRVDAAATPRGLWWLGSRRLGTGGPG